MKHFIQREIREAIAYAKAGGQALHTHRIIVDRSKAPSCFKRDVDAGRDIAHLFDQDVKRLTATVRRLGVKIVVVENEGRRGQHVDLCGQPLERALKLCEPREEKSFIDRMAEVYGERHRKLISDALLWYQGQPWYEPGESNDREFVDSLMSRVSDT
jgi:hypothetical protein